MGQKRGRNGVKMGPKKKITGGGIESAKNRRKIYGVSHVNFARGTRFLAFFDEKWAKMTIFGVKLSQSEGTQSNRGAKIGGSGWDRKSTRLNSSHTS